MKSWSSWRMTAPQGRPEDEALADLFVHVEEPQFLAQLAVVTLLRFLEAGEGRLERLLRGLDQAVDANELFAVLIATPVGGRHRGQAHVHERRRGGHVRAKAEVVPVALAVDGRAVAVLELVVDDFDVVRVVGKVLAQVVLVQAPRAPPCGCGGRFRASSSESP